MRRLSPVLLIGFAGLLIFGSVAPAAAPLTLTSPVSGSMEPTAPEHSLIVIVSGEPKVGDIALYETPTREEPVLHRIVGETAAGEGFITQGDTNGYTDQEAGDPPLTTNELYGVVPTIGGYPVIIPYVGGAITNPIVIIGLWVLLVFSALYSSPMGTTTRDLVDASPFRSYAILVGLLIILIVPIAILATATTMDAQIIISTTASPDATHITAPGETTEHTLSLTSPFLSFLHVSAHASGDLVVADVEKRTGGQTASVIMSNTPSSDPTVHDGSVTMYMYPMVLPDRFIQGLAAVHPGLAAFVSGLIIGGPVLLLGLLSDKHGIARVNRVTLRRHRRSQRKRFDREDRFR